MATTTVSNQRIKFWWNTWRQQQFPTNTTAGVTLFLETFLRFFGIRGPIHAPLNLTLDSGLFQFVLFLFPLYFRGPKYLETKPKNTRALWNINWLTRGRRRRWPLISRLLLPPPRPGWTVRHSYLPSFDRRPFPLISLLVESLVFFFWSSSRSRHRKSGTAAGRYSV
jgi:hypothetical protein